MNTLSLLAFLSGSAIAIQACMNAQLGILLKAPVLAACIAFCSSLLFTSIMAFCWVKEWPTFHMLKVIPYYLWFSGGLLSAVAISGFYYLIPRMGVGVMMTFALSGQLVVAMIVGHFAWFGTPAQPITIYKITGMTALMLGVWLINKESF